MDNLSKGSNDRTDSFAGGTKMRILVDKMVFVVLKDGLVKLGGDKFTNRSKRMTFI